MGEAVKIRVNVYGLSTGTKKEDVVESWSLVEVRLKFLLTHLESNITPVDDL